MSKKFIKQNIELSLELDRYLSRHERAFRNIPRGACIIITKEGDPNFNRQSKGMVENAKEECVEARKTGKKWLLRPLGV